MVWREEKNSGFPKLFVGGYLFVFVEHLCNCSPKIKRKNIKNYSSILTIVNHWNWLDDSPPLSTGTYPDLMEVAEVNDGGTILKVGGPKVYSVFSPTARNA